MEYHKKEFQQYWEERGKELEKIEENEAEQMRKRRKQLADY